MATGYWILDNLVMIPSLVIFCFTSLLLSSILYIHMRAFTQPKHGRDEDPLCPFLGPSQNLDSELNGPAASRNSAMLRTPKKTAPDAPVFLSRAESDFVNLPAKKKKSGQVIVERVTKQIEEEFVETGKIGWMRRAREMGCRPGTFIILPANVAKYDPWAKSTPYRGPSQDASAASAGGGSAATSRWPSVREARRRKHIPIPGPGQRPLPRQLCALWDEQCQSQARTVPKCPQRPPPPPPSSHPAGGPGKTGPQYNAFAGDGYWATHGYVASPKADQRPRAATESWDRSSDSDSDSDSLIMKTTKRRREVNYGPTIPRNPMFRSHTTPAAFFTQDTRPPPATIPALESNRHSSETDATVEEKPFNSVDFLEQISVFPGRPTGESHPFPEVEKVPNDPDIREAYEQVRSTLVGFWYSHVRAKQEDDVRREKEREEQEGTAEQKKPKDSEKWLPSFPQLKSSPSRPQLKAKPSLFEKLLHPGAMKTEESLNMCNQDDDSQSVSEKSDVTVVHIGPAPKSKKSYKDLHLQALKPKSYKDLQVLKSSSCKDLTQKTQITKSETTNRRPSSHARTSAREALAITQVVLRQLQADIIPPPLITRPTSDPEPGSHSKSKNKLKAKEKDKDKDASKSSKDKDKRKSLTKPIPQTLEAYMLRLPEVYDSHSAAIAADERECWKTYTIHSMSQLCYRGYWHIRLSPRDWIDPDFVADPDEYKFETILERQVAGLKVLRERRKGGDGRILKAALRVVWATKMVEVMERLCAGLEGKGRSEGVVEENSKDRTSEDGTANVLHSVVSNDTDAQTSITTRSHTYIPDRDQDFTHKSTAKDAVDANSDTNTIIHHDPNKENQPSSSPNTRLPYDIYIRAIRSQPGSAPQPPTTPRFPREQLHAAYKRVAERLAPGALPPEGHPAFRAEGVPLKGSSIQTSLPQVSMPNVSMMKRQRPAVPTSMARVAEVKRPALQTSVSDPLALQKTMTIGEVEKGTGLQGEGLKVPRLRPLRQVHAPGKEGAEDGDDEDDDEKGANARTRKMRWRKTTFNMGLVYGGDASDEE